VRLPLRIVLLTPNVAGRTILRLVDSSLLFLGDDTVRFGLGFQLLICSYSLFRRLASCSVSFPLAIP
jgi:hypothetical protein